MKIKYTFQDREKTIELEKPTVKSLLEKLEINPETVLVSRNKEIVLSSQKLDSKDLVEIIQVISGG